jgi:hypothetical protein
MSWSAFGGSSTGQNSYNLTDPDIIGGISDSRTKITINGRQTKHRAVKMGMNCTFNYPGPGEEAKIINSKS